MNQRRHIGILGGMFDPVHHGHLHTAVSVRDAVGLDEMRLLPCSRPAHRDSAHVDDARRIDMLRLATEGVSGLRVDDRECRRDGPSYLYDTMLSLREELPGEGLYFVLGSDAFLGLERWHRWEPLLELCHWLVVPRPGTALAPEGRLGEEFRSRRAATPEALKQMAGGGIWEAEPSPLNLSSTLIRSRLAHGRTPRFLLPDSVIEYIEQQHLYTAMALE